MQTDWIKTLSNKRHPSTLRPNEASAQESLFSRAKERGSGFSLYTFLTHSSVYLFLSPSPSPTPPPPPPPSLFSDLRGTLSANGTGSSSQLSTPISKHSPTSTPTSPALNNKQKVPGQLSSASSSSLFNHVTLFYHTIIKCSLCDLYCFLFSRISTCRCLWMTMILRANPCKLSPCSAPPVLAWNTEVFIRLLLSTVTHSATCCLGEPRLCLFFKALATGATSQFAAWGSHKPIKLFFFERLTFWPLCNNQLTNVPTRFYLEVSLFLKQLTHPQISRCKDFTLVSNVSLKDAQTLRFMSQNLKQQIDIFRGVRSKLTFWITCICDVSQCPPARYA